MEFEKVVEAFFFNRFSFLREKMHLSIAQHIRHYYDSVMELAGQPMPPPHHIYGIDFSGAKYAGKKIRPYTANNFFRKNIGL